MGTKKSNGYSNKVLHAKRDAKRDKAMESKAHYQSLTIQERIKLVESRPGNSKRELARLEKQLALLPPPVKKETIATQPVVKKVVRREKGVNKVKQVKQQ